MLTKEHTVIILKRLWIKRSGKWPLINAMNSFDHGKILNFHLGRLYFLKLLAPAIALLAIMWVSLFLTYLIVNEHNSIPIFFFLIKKGFHCVHFESPSQKEIPGAVVQAWPHLDTTDCEKSKIKVNQHMRSTIIPKFSSYSDYV